MRAQNQVVADMLPALDDLEGWDMVLSRLTGNAPEDEEELWVQMPRVTTVAVFPCGTPSGSLIAVDWWHGGNNGVVATYLLDPAATRILGVLDDGHFRVRLGPEDELVTEAAVWGPYDQAPRQASVIEERYYRIVDGEPKQIAYAEVGSLHATPYAVDHYYEMLEHDPEWAQEKLHPALRSARAGADAPTAWALNPRRLLATEQTLTRKVPVRLDHQDTEPLGYWLVEWSAASRQWLLLSFRAATVTGPWSDGWILTS